MKESDSLEVKSWLSAGWTTFKKFPVKLILSHLLSFAFIELNEFSFLVATLKEPAFLILGGLAGCVLEVGVCFFCLRLTRGLDMPFSAIFDGFRRFGPALLTALFLYLILFVGFILWLVPAMIWCTKYGMAYFAVLDRQLSAVEAIRLSARITTGYKWSLFAVGMILLVPCVLAGGVSFTGTRLHNNLLMGFGYASLIVFYCLIGPWITCSLAVAYDRLLKREAGTEVLNASIE
jgi:uncharacterized membrane protein